MDGCGSIVTIKKDIGKGIDENALSLSSSEKKAARRMNECVDKSDDEDRRHLARCERGAVIGVGSGRWIDDGVDGMGMGVGVFDGF